MTVTVVSLTSATVIAIVYPKILFLLSFMGGVCGGIFILVLPGKEYVAMFRMDVHNIKYKSPTGLFLMTFNTLLFGVGIVSTIITA